MLVFRIHAHFTNNTHQYWGLMHARLCSLLLTSEAGFECKADWPLGTNQPLTHSQVTHIICKPWVVAVGEMNQTVYMQCGQKHGCWGRSTAQSTGLPCMVCRSGSSSGSMRPPRTNCRPITVCHGHMPWLPGAFLGHQRAATLARTSSRKNKHPLNLLILFYFATQKWLLSTQARNSCLSHGG